YDEYGYPPPDLEQWRAQREGEREREREVEERGSGGGRGEGNGAGIGTETGIGTGHGERKTCDRCGKKFFPGHGVWEFAPHQVDAPTAAPPPAPPTANPDQQCTFHPTRSTLLAGPRADPTRVLRCCGRPVRDPGDGCVQAGSHVWKEEGSGGGGGWEGFVGWGEWAREKGEGEEGDGEGEQRKGEVEGEGDGNGNGNGNGDGKGRTYGVLALDCEMVYTTMGMECGRLTVVGRVDPDEHEHEPSPTPPTTAPPPPVTVLLDTMVLPQGRLLDPNTLYSGLHHASFHPTHPTLPQARARLFRLMREDTVLLGHGLENDLRCLKVAHGRCVDTAQVFPHRRGMPVRNGLRYLVKRVLGREIQGVGKGAAVGSGVGSVGTAGEGAKDEGKVEVTAKVGHDPVEDATGAWELVEWRVGKGESWKGFV
ncbi:hypothetical protein HDU93_001847, partial [Gonapodya sp. JEL0774]